MRTKRLIAMLLTLVMLLQAVPFAAEPKDFSDFPEKGNWAYDAMEAALENGLLHGKGDGIIAPSANLTRAEFAAVVTRAFGATKTKDVSFLTDVKAGDWFYEDNSVSKAYQMGVMNGTSDSTFHPLDSMRREDVFLTLARALFVEGTDEEVLSKFTDKAKIDKWAKNALIGMVDEEYVNGYYNEEDEEWSLKPRANITRAELAQVFHNLFKYYISSYDVTEENKGVFGGKSKDEKKVYDGSLVVRTPGVTLQNAVINGDLVIADGVGEDKFTLINTDVKGSIIIRGGEGKVGTTESATVRNVDFINFTVDGKVIVNNVNGTVNFHNYKSDFKNGVVEHTPATYLPTATGGGGGGGGGGGVTKYTYYVRHFLEPLEDGAEYIHNSDDDFKASVSKNTVVYPLRDAESFYGFEIDEEHENYEAYADGVKINAKDMTFDVYFKRSTFKVELGGKDENGDDFDDLEIRYEDVLTQDDLPDSAYEEEGEKFVGWSEEDDGTVDDEITITENTTLYPVYTYTVKFVPYNAAEVVKTDIPYNYVLTDMDVPADPTEIEAGKKYVGWSTTEDGSSGVVDTIVGVTITEPVTYYQVVVDKEAVEYYVDHYFQQLDGSYKTDADILDRQHFWERPGIEVTAIPATTGIEGFEYFAGHDEEALKGVVPEAEDGELVLKVYYNRLKYDVVIYDEDGREIDRVEDVMYGDTVDADELPSDEDMAKPGKVFEGWATKPDADADDVVDLDDLTIDKDTTALYPVYTDKEPVEYRVEYYFENAEDDGYTLDASYTVVDRETPDFEVEAELLTPDLIPDGFEYFEHDDEILKATQTESGVTLKVYYKRLTFTVSFDVPGYAPKTYKYGETLKLEDIPEDDDVEVPDYKQFMGWATEPDKTAGTSREDLAGTEITDGIKFYPAFGDLGAVTYKKIYYFEELDGSYKADEEEFSEIPGKTVTMDMLPVDEIPEGFEYYAHADEKTEGIVEEDGSLVLKVYYNRKTFTVSFDVPGYAPKTYKYGETLKLEDIPEDNEVEVPDYKQFMGWATEPDKTAGTSREDLAGTEITDGISFYPAFGDLGAVIYKKIYYFEELDGSYKAQEEILSGVPGNTVTMDKLAEADIPVGFEYYAHADEKTEGVVEEDGSLVLKVYYNRKTFTVKFGEISEETYKYGYELVLSDIPEDDEVEVTDDMKFMGWSTQEDATEGVAREELVGTVVEGELVYYPVIIPKDMVTYYVEHYFEALELNDDGTVKYELYECEELNGKIGTSVRAEFLEEDGFERIDHAEQILSGQIPKEGEEALVLKVYYGRKLLKVEFYDATGNFYDSDTQTYSEPSAVVEVRYGTKVDDAENLEKYAQAEVEYKKNRFKLKRGTEKGFWREPEFGNAYNTLGGRVYHTIPLYWWYEDAESGEYEKFYVEGADNELVFTEDVTEVYTKAKIVEFRLMMDDFKYEGYFYAYYDDETRLLDTVKDVLFVNAASITDAVNLTGAEDKAYGELAEKGLFHYVDGEYEITNVNKFVRFARLMGEKNFEEFLDSFINQDAVTSVEDFLFDYLTTHDTDESAVHLKELVDGLVVDHKDIARDMIGEVAVDLIEKEVTHVEEFFMTYTSSLVEAGDTEDLEEMIADMFKEYKKTNEDQFVGFVTDVVVKALSEDTPNKDVVKMIEDYIKSEIKKGTFDAEIVNYIMSMSDDDFKSAAASVIKEDVSIIENDVNEKLLSDDSFVETIIDEIFALESDTVDKEIKKYIKDYNLADNYIMNNPEVIVDYITDEQIGEIWGSYMPGVTITRQEKIDAVTQYIADNPDTAVDTLKGYAGKDLDKVVNDYYDNHRDDVKGAVYTEVMSNFTLRTELASFAMSLIKDDEFSDLLDFAIDDYLGGVLADEDKKRELAETEVERLSNEKIYELDFVQDAIDTVVDDVIADIQANENDGDENTESVYIANVKAYAKSLNDFSDIVSAFITADEDFRNEIIVKLFDNLYASDPEHKIILQFMEKITDKMIDEGDIDVNILVTIIDYIKDSGEHGHTLTRDIIDGLMKLGDELVSYVEAHLGWADESGKLEASLKFRRQATYEEEFEVNADNLFIMKLVDEKVRSMTFEAFMNEYVYPRLPDKVPDSIFDKLPMEIIEDLYDNAISEFLFDLEEAIKKAEENGESSMVGSGVVIRVNPVDDLADPLYDWVMDGYDKANAKAESLGGRIGEIYLSYYRDNPYIEDIINLSDIYNYLDGEGRPAEEPSSGYSISSFEDVYYNVVMPSAVLSDDLFVWYLNKIDFGKIRGLAEDNEDLILAMYNHPNVLMERYAQEGLPDTMSDYYEDLMEDPDIKAAFKKIDNKVSFEMEPFVMRFLTNSTAEMYYYKALEKFGMKADEILDKYEGASVKKEITHENFTDLLDEIQYCWEDGNANATTDYVLDGGLKELFSIVSIEKSFRGYTVSFERKFADR